jgi:hypothetical protein
LALELIGTGDQAGTWGNTTNTNLGTLIEQAISGYVTQAVSTGTDTTITIPNGATGVARNMFIELTGTGGTNTNLIVPANKKLYFIYNNASGAVTVKVSGQTGVSVGAGEKVILVSNGTDIVEATSYLTGVPSSLTVTTLNATSLTVTGNTYLATSSGNVGIGLSSLTIPLQIGKGGGGNPATSGTTQTYGIARIGSSGAAALDVGTYAAGQVWMQGVDVTNLATNYDLVLQPNGGSVGIGGTPTANRKLELLGSFPVLSGNTNSNGIFTVLEVPSAITGSAYVFRSGTSIAASTATTNVFSYVAGDVILGSGASLTNSYGFYAASLGSATNNYGFYSDISSGSNRWSFYAAGTARNYFAGGVEDAAGNLRDIPSAGTAKTSAYTLTVSDVGEFVTVGSGGSITVPNDTFTAGNVISIYNDTTGNISINFPITTAYQAGTNTDKASLTLSTRGIATILFINPSLCVASGNLS